MIVGRSDSNGPLFYDCWKIASQRCNHDRLFTIVGRSAPHNTTITFVRSLGDRNLAFPRFILYDRWRSESNDSTVPFLRLLAGCKPTIQRSPFTIVACSESDGATILFLRPLADLHPTTQRPLFYYRWEIETQPILFERALVYRNPTINDPIFMDRWPTGIQRSNRPLVRLGVVAWRTTRKAYFTCHANVRYPMGVP